MEQEYTCTWDDFGCHIDWMFDEIRVLFVWISEQVLGALVYLLGLIPVPNWAQNPDGFGAAIPSSVWFFASAANLDFGAGIIASAYAIRFLIRRLPVIG